MSFGEAVKSVLGQYVGFSGRARRSEYWFFYLFTVLVIGALYAVAIALLASGAAGDPEAPNAVGGLVAAVIGVVALALFLPSLAVAIRRLHDTGRSGWWYLITFVPLGGIVLLVFFVLDSEPGANRFGPNPKGGALAQGGGGYGAAGYGSASPDPRYGTPPQG